MTGRKFKFLRADATLDSAGMQCRAHITDGEELRNSQVFSVGGRHCSIAFPRCQGQAGTGFRWLVFRRLGILKQSGAPAALLLQVQDCLLPKENQELPFARHRPGAFQHFDFVQDVKAGVLVRAQEIVIGHP